MLTIAYVAFVAAFAALFWQSMLVYRARRSSYTLLLAIVLAGLAYDTFTILIGRFLGEGTLLQTLNAGRYLVHGIATPSMMIFAFGVLRSGNIGWAQSRAAHIGVCVFTTLLIALGIYQDVIALELAPRTVFDTLRYVNEGGMKGPPIPALLTIFFLIAAGILLGRGTGWWGLTIGALLMFLAAGGGMGDRFYLGNLGEVALGIANVLTARKFLS